MGFRTRRVALAAVCVVLLFSLAAHAQARKEQPRPKLVVVLVVDQMRADYVENFRRQWTGGLRRLLEQGAWFRKAAYPYLNTVTCAGHATISTGNFPATHGIVLNTWWDRNSGRLTSCTDDPQVSAVSYGPAVRGGHSSSRLALPTFTDELRAQADGPVRVVTLSLKARSAIMLAGRRADAVTWFETAAGAWTTSSAYTTSPVPFIQEFLKAHPVERDFGKSWTRALPDQAYLYGNKEPRGNQQRNEKTSSFPHVLSRTDKPDAAFFAAWAASPFSDAYLGELARGAVDALGLGKGPGTDYLGVSFSALDLVGHRYGPRSHEVQDVLVRLDATIGRLLAHLDHIAGKQNYVVALSSDHGVAPIPEQVSRLGLDSGRIVTQAIVQRMEKVLEPHLGPGKHVARMVYTDFYFAPGVYAKLAADPKLMQVATDAMMAVPGVWRVFRSEELMARQRKRDPVARAAALSYYPGRSGDLIVIPKPYWFFVEASRETPAGPATTHGTAHSYDTRVPLILMGPGIKPGEYLGRATPADIAPTLASLLGITLAHTQGRVLAEALASPAPPRTTAPLPRR